MTQSQGPSGARRVRFMLAFALATLLFAELAVRARASTMPDPLRWSAPEAQYKEAQIADLRRHGGASVVFLGSSVVDVGVDPTLVPRPAGSRPVYNAGTGGGSIGMIAVWARRVAIPRLRPDFAVLGIVSRELNPNDPVQAKLERDFRSAAAVKHLEGTEGSMDRAARRAAEWSALFKYRTLLRTPRFFANVVGVGSAPTRHTRSTTTADDGQYLGFLKLSYNGGQAVNQLFSGTALRDYRVGAGQLSTLRDLLSFLTARVAHVLVVDMPVTEAYVRLHPRGASDQAAFERALGDQATSAGARLVAPGIWPNDLFADPAHMNERGAQRFSALISDELAKLRT